MKKTLVAAALIGALGVSATASADVIEISWSGLFTMGAAGAAGIVTNPSAAGLSDPFGAQTPVAGTMTFDTDTGAGSATLDPFVFSGNTASLTPGLTTLQAIGDGMGGPGTLVMASMDFNWGPNVNIPVYLVGDAAGFFNAGPYSIGQVITGVGASSSTMSDYGAFAPFLQDLTSIPFAMTTYDVNQDANGNMVGGGFPLGDDGLSGTAMATAPFPAHRANFDITTMTITNITTEVPVPAAVWLLGSGLVGLVGVARRRKAVA
jgi:hypothetical protein